MIVPYVPKIQAEAMSFRSDHPRVVVPFAGRRPAAITPVEEISDQPALRPVLIVLHQETSTPGRIGNALRALGYPCLLYTSDAADE